MIRRTACIAALALSLLIGGCVGILNPTGSQTPPAGPTTPASPPTPAGPTPSTGEPPPVGQPPLNPVEAKIGQSAAAALTALHDSDLAALAALVHPEKGVRFSPYGHVRTDGDYAHKLFTVGELTASGVLDETYVWGAYDGSGEDIVLTVRDYFARFVYNYEYTAAPLVGWNTVVKEGNTLLNHQDVYPDSLFVDFHFPGSAQYEGMDWGTLRLVFEEHNGTWHLVGIIHDQWTI